MSSVFRTASPAAWHCSEHGYRRFTEDVDILVTREGLREIHSGSTVSAILPPFPRSKNLRDTENGVRIEFLVAGDYPGDGKPKPAGISRPRLRRGNDRGHSVPQPATADRAEARFRHDESGLACSDLSDVMELIKLRNLPESFAEQLDPYVRSRFRELWSSTRATIHQVCERSSFEPQVPRTARTHGRDARKLTLSQSDAEDGVIFLPEGSPSAGTLYLVNT